MSRGWVTRRNELSDEYRDGIRKWPFCIRCGIIVGDCEGLASTVELTTDDPKHDTFILLCPRCTDEIYKFISPFYSAFTGEKIDPRYQSPVVWGDESLDRRRKKEDKA